MPEQELEQYDFEGKKQDINPNHLVVIDRLSKVQTNKDDKTAKDTASVILQTALIESYFVFGVDVCNSIEGRSGCSGTASSICASASGGMLSKRHEYDMVSVCVHNSASGVGASVSSGYMIEARFSHAFASGGHTIWAGDASDNEADNEADDASNNADA